jgi:broad specificity phosphatase PhoE
MARLYLLRHGETEWNAENRICGRTDAPLSAAGRRQALRLAARLKPIAFEALYSSPLARASATAHLIAPAVGLEPILSESLVELDYGEWEGKNWEEISRHYSETLRAWEADPAELAPPGGETGLAAQQRAVAFLDLLATRHTEGPVLVVFHKTVCRLAICHVLGIAPSEYRRRLVLDNASLSIIQSQPDGWQLLTYNDTAHLARGYRGRSG